MHYLGTIVQSISKSDGNDLAQKQSCLLLDEITSESRQLDSQKKAFGGKEHFPIQI